MIKPFLLIGILFSFISASANPPKIKFVNPTSSSVIKEGDLVTVQLDITDSDGEVVYAYLSIDGKTEGTFSGPPYQTTWRATGGAVKFLVEAFDDSQERSVEELTLIVKKPDFFVKLKEPKNYAVYKTGDPVAIEADVTSAQPVTAVEFFVNDKLISEDVTAPFTAKYVAETGVALIKAVAISAGKQAEDSVYIKVNNAATNQLPFTRMVAYYNGGVFGTGSPLNIEATASDPDGQITSVEFFANGFSIGTDNTEPYSFFWNVREGMTEITAIATDNKGAKGKPSEPFKLYGDDNFSRLKIMQPLGGSIYKPGNKVKIEAYSSCLESFSLYKRSRIRFTVNDQNLGIIQEYPYTVNWIAEKGKAVIKAYATDNFDDVIDSVTVMVDDGTQNLPPVVKITRPDKGRTLNPGTPLSIEADARDADGTLESVSFFANNTLISVDSVAPYQVSWISINGVTLIKAVARDNKGALATDSVPIKVIPNVAPIVKITSPKDGDILQPNNGVFAEVTATDAVGEILFVEFFINNVSQGKDAEAPYKLYLPIENIKDLILKAVATDDKGLQSADSITLHVNVLIDSIQVKIKSPLLSASYGLDEMVTLEATATAVSPAKIDYVQFQVNDNINLYDSVAPYSVKWKANTPGLVKLEVFAAHGNKLAMDAGSFFVRESDFEVKIIRPKNNSNDEVKTNTPFTFEALASDSKNKITNVEFFVDGSSAGIDTTSPYSATWPGTTKPERLMIIAVAINSLGEHTADTVVVDVDPDDVVMNVTNPLNGQVFKAGDLVTIDAQLEQFYAVQYHICNAEFFVNDVSIGFESKIIKDNPFTATWVAKKGYAIIKVVAWSNTYHKVVTQTVAIKVVDSVAINKPPVVEITAPLNGAIYHPNDNIAIEAKATDEDGTVKFVLFYINNTLVAKDSVAPYTIIWSTPTKGDYTIIAKATDNLAAVGTSPVVNITVTISIGMEDEKGDRPVSLYPNPAATVLNVESPENAMLQLLSMDGKTILLQTNVIGDQRSSIHLNSIANGSYIVKIYNEQFVTHKKIVINR